MVSKDDLWPKYFNTPEAIVDDIELCFFPSEARALQGSSSHLLLPNKIQIPDNVLATRDIVNDRAST
ncbi:hypothetical protein H5410_040955 [Solanum commersonii]|uniref:Uncharacterized protein n=1 Tax=Solanum commersonii TaxID=4109 RepID=A0A9J5XQF8_SOLCO|nr:hypothetical protein H5410_040955 [Solanum commersonii]